MRLGSIAGRAFDHLLGRMLRRALVAIVTTVCAIVAFYYFTAASSLALEAEYGAVNANLIIGGIYSGFAVIGIGLVWVMRNRTATGTATPALASQREMQLVILVEAVMLGYALARKGSRAH
jgi:hypothetical protein